MPTHPSTQPHFFAPAVHNRDQRLASLTNANEPEWRGRGSQCKRSRGAEQPQAFAICNPYPAAIEIGRSKASDIVVVGSGLMTCRVSGLVG